MRPGLFISFEGGDACGKSTQISLLAQGLRDLGHQVVVTREPGGTELGNTLRGLIQHGPADVDPRSEALMYAADRAYHVANLIRPALDEGKIVLCDRYLDSSVAYQGAARDLGTSEIRELSLWATQGLLPDATVLLDADPVALKSRQEGVELDRLESEAIEFHQAVRHQFLELAKAEPQRFLVVDALGEIAQIQARIGSGLAQRLPALSGLERG